MKKITILATMLAFALSSDAQNRDNVRKNYNDEVYNTANYIGISGGFRNPRGPLGLEYTRLISDNLTATLGGGIGTHGFKVGLEAMYGLKPNNLGFQVGGGLSYCTGLGDNQSTFTYKNTSTNTNETILYTSKALPIVNILTKYQFKMGKKSRFFLQLGWGVGLGSAYKPITDLSTASTATVDAYKIATGISSPAGLIFGGGFNFGLK